MFAHLAALPGLSLAALEVLTQRVRQMTRPGRLGQPPLFIRGLALSGHCSAAFRSLGAWREEII